MKDVVINICGKIDDGHSVDNIEFAAVGRYECDGGRYELSYDDGQNVDAPVVSRIIIESDGTAIIERTGGINSRLNIKEGCRTQSSYQIPEGELLMGINGITVDNRLTQSGGQVRLCYSIDINAALQSKNEVLITVKEA